MDATVLMAMGLIFLGSFVQSAIGFGLAIVAAPLLFMLNPLYVPAPICLVALFISLLNAWKHKSSVSLGGLKMAVIGRIPGSVMGGLLLFYVSLDSMSLWLGLFVLFAVAVSLLPFRIEPTPTRMCVAGFFSGFMGTSSSIGGPPMALLLQHQEANSLRGNLSAFFVVSSVLSLLVQIPAGFFNWQHVVATVPLIPAAWLGYWLAGKCIHKFSKQWIRYCALVLCLASGLGAVWQALG